MLLSGFKRNDYFGLYIPGVVFTQICSLIYLTMKASVMSRKKCKTSVDLHLPAIACIVGLKTSLGKS